MMRIYKDGVVCAVADTHFGRVFKEGVPLDKRGLYEKKILEEFKEALAVPCAEFVHLGDLFDSVQVSNEVLVSVFKVIFDRVSAHPEGHYTFIAGNHDLPREKDADSSFKILSIMLSGFKNVHFVMDKPVVIGRFCYMPWSYFDDYNSFKEFENANYIFGHFNDPAPAGVSAARNLTRLSGHYHKAHFSDDGVFYIGSLEPIAFGEESDDSSMKTITLEEYNNTPPSEFEGKRIRVLLKQGEELPSFDTFKGLQLTGKVQTDIDDDLDLEVDFSSDFDFKTKFYEYLQDCKIKNELWDLYETLKAEE